MNEKRDQAELEQADPVFEGFVLKVLDKGAKAKARQAAGRVLGQGWVARGFGDDATDFEVTRRSEKGARLSARRAWEKTYALRAQPGVTYAEPIFTVPVSGPPGFRAEAVEQTGDEAEATPARASRRASKSAAAPVAARGLFTGDGDLPESNDPAWSIKAVKVPEAWKRFAAGREPGADVVVGHPDTGYTLHPEIASRLITNKGFDFVKNDSDAKDELKRGLLLFPGHGTGTSSVIVSPQGPQTNFGALGGNPLAVWGVAPGAKLIPVRVSTSVVLLGGGVLNLARAIEWAADKNVHVISMSMGTGFPNSRLLKAVQYAQKRGVIVLAAAGNYVGFVVWPAAYDEVIAVAASNARNKTWQHSSRGSAVDVTAPGESVWCAGVEDNGGFSVGRGSGTSFAVATVAGVAALWLSHHGRDKLVKRYGAEKLPLVFNQILRDTCDPLVGAGSGFGRGLVNADRVLAAPLPDGLQTPLPSPAFALRELPSIDSGGLATFRHLFESAAATARGTRAASTAITSDAELRARLSELLGVGEEELPARLREVGQELAFHLVSDPALYEAFAASLSQKRPKAAAKKAAAKGGTRPAAAARAATTAPVGVAALRSALMLKDTSAALKVKVSGAG